MFGFNKKCELISKYTVKVFEDSSGTLSLKREGDSLNWIQSLYARGVYMSDVIYKASHDNPRLCEDIINIMLEGCQYLNSDDRVDFSSGTTQILDKKVLFIHEDFQPPFEHKTVYIQAQQKINEKKLPSIHVTSSKDTELLDMVKTVPIFMESWIYEFQHDFDTNWKLKQFFLYFFRGVGLIYEHPRKFADSEMTVLAPAQAIQYASKIVQTQEGALRS